MWCNPVNHAVNVVVDRREIDIGRSAANPELRGVAVMRSRVASREQGLGGHTTIVETVAPHLAALKQRNTGPHLDGPSRDGQTARTGTNHTYIDITNFAHDFVTMTCREGKQATGAGSGGCLFPRLIFFVDHRDQR